MSLPAIDAAPLTADDPVGQAIERFVFPELPAADGFSSPGPGRAPRAIGLGVVRAVVTNPDGVEVQVEHLYYENVEQQRIFTIYRGLEKARVTVGATVARGQSIGQAGRRGSVAIHAAEPGGGPGRSLEIGAFLRGRGQLFVPASEATLLVIDSSTYHLHHYQRGVLIDHLEIGLGQARGPKVRQGDLRTPRGMYFVIDKHRGEFSGRYGAWYGGHWIKVNYPNPWDAERGLAAGWLDPTEAEQIRSAWAQRAATSERTPLGGGIGLHGWNGEWSGEGGAHLSFGCVVLHNADIAALYDQIPRGAMVVIL